MEAIPNSKIRENYIPIRASELVEVLAIQPHVSRTAGEQFRNFCRLLSASFHFQYHRELEQLKDAYAPIDPDAETCDLVEITAEMRERSAAAFFDKMVWLLQRANFRRLSPTEIHEAVGATSDFGLRIDLDFSIFERLEVYARGDGSTLRARRSWRNWMRRTEVEIPIHERLAVIFRAHHSERPGEKIDPDVVHLKLFKNIPKMDLDMLLPGTRIRMSMFDRAKIFVPTLGGLGFSLFKLAQGAVVLATAGVYGLLGLLGMVGGTVGYGFKSFIGYQRTLQKYQLNLTRSLYYQNLDNNAGVLFRLLDEAEEQECREAMLAYFFLWSQNCNSAGNALRGVPEPTKLPWTIERLDIAIEQFIRNTCGCDVDFEVGDALDKLKRLGIVTTSSQGVLTAVPIAAALAKLDGAWDNAFRYSAAG